MTKEIFLPSEVPWSALKGKLLEELLYWLFDSMGAKDLEWRVGGTGQGTADQGRDLELSFYVSSPDGDLVRQNWWVEAKGRTGTVESAEVKNAVVNALGNDAVDVIVIATNTAFSNPTRDWVRQWQSQHPRPRVKLWERTELENHCSKNPLAILRLFSKALNSQGRLEVARRKLWDYMAFTDVPTLELLWKDRKELEITSHALFALIASEMANGDIEERSWAAAVESEDALISLGAGLVNFPYMLLRANEAGVRTEPMIDALSYLLLIITYRCGDNATSRLLDRIWDTVEDREYPQEIRQALVQPLLRTVYAHVRDVCTSDCSRIHSDRMLLHEEQVATYLNRLSGDPSTTARAVERKEHILTMESFEAPCRIGLSLNKDRHCPVCAIDDAAASVEETLSVVQLVTRARRPLDGRPVARPRPD